MLSFSHSFISFCRACDRYVCMYACVYVCMYVMYVNMYVCMYVYMYACMYACVCKNDNIFFFLNT